MGIVNISVVSTLKMRLSKILGVVLTHEQKSISIQTSKGCYLHTLEMFRSLVRKTTPLLAFGVGIAAFPKDWRKGQFGDKKLLVINDSVLEQIRSTDRYKQLVNDPNLKHYNSSHAFPDQHHKIT